MLDFEHDVYTRKETITYRGIDYEIDFHYILDGDGLEYTTTELDNINLGQIPNYFEE